MALCPLLCIILIVLMIVVIRGHCPRYSCRKEDCDGRCLVVPHPSHDRCHLLALTWLSLKANVDLRIRNHMTSNPLYSSVWRRGQPLAEVAMMKYQPA